MGEYWKLVNVTKSQHIHPHEVNNGLKWGEWADYDSDVILRARALVAAGVWGPDDEIRAVSDCGGNRLVRNLATLDYAPSEGTVGGEDASLYRNCGEDVSTRPPLPDTGIR